jgi:ATP-dependent helicase/nuclease subunit B
LADTFLKFVANYYLEQTEFAPEEICIVFPNKRASVFFRKELHLLNPQVQWLPDCFSAEDFVCELTGIQRCESITQLFEFYEVYRNLEGTAAESFDVFSTWAPQLLHDFQEIDLYLVNSRQLFGTIDDAYALKKWSPDGKVLTFNQEQYLKFWSRMGNWYVSFKEQLIEKKLSTVAMAARMLAENIETYTDNLPWRKVVFAGFNALNQAEQTYMRFLESRKKAVILWDVDTYYLNNELNEAGLFFRKYRKNWPIGVFNKTGSALTDEPHEINIVGVAKNLGQALVAGSVLNKLSKTSADLTDTALVLCDEQLLMPVLEMLPKQLEQVNITMGYPLGLLPMSSLFQIVFDLHQKVRISKSKTAQPAFYFKDVLRLLRNPVIASVLNPESIKRLLDKIRNDKPIFLTRSFLLNPIADEPSPLYPVSFLLENWNNEVSKACDVLKELVDFIKTNLLEKNQLDTGLDGEALFAISRLLNRISAWQTDFEGFNTIRTFQRIFLQLLKQQTLPFYGEPLTGLQLMGLLETRNLDFKNLILLSVNEGVLPAAKMNRSFIPPDIATFFGLPTYKERDAIYGYHFYRMLQHAERVWLIYNTESDELGKGEQSRFITQLEEEWKSPGVTINRETYVPKLPDIAGHSISIPKTPELISRLKKRIDGSQNSIGLSPTALSSFVNCSLQFYFKYLSGAKVIQEKDDDIGADMLGTVVHEVLENFFKPLEGKVLRKKDVTSMFSQISEKVRSQFLKVLDESNLDYGKNLLTLKGAEQMVKNFLLQELSFIEQLEIEKKSLLILNVETDLSCKLEFESAEGVESALFFGKADRIDLLDGVLRVVDYKTGHVDDKHVKVAEVFEIIENPEKAKGLQLMQYALMVPDEYKKYPLQPGILSLRKPSKGLIELKIGKQTTLDAGLLLEVEEVFRFLLNNLLDPSKPFEQTDDQKRCIYCDFKEICNR